RMAGVRGAGGDAEGDGGRAEQVARRGARVHTRQGAPAGPGRRTDARHAGSNDSLCPRRARALGTGDPRQRHQDRLTKRFPMTTELRYQSGFGNQFSSEAEPGTLPVGRNSPQKVARGLYAELVSGSAFTAPRAADLRTWLYRRRPSVLCGAYEPHAQPHWKTGAQDGVVAPPHPLRWHPIPRP